MNRRKFLTNIFGLLTMAPFLSIKEGATKIIGVDEATPEKDQTFYSMLDIKNRTIIPIQWEQNHFNCKCNLEWDETE